MRNYLPSVRNEISIDEITVQDATVESSEKSGRYIPNIPLESIMSKSEGGPTKRITTSNK
mgnify:CR=1 FL=1